jgi:hypothetical protein
VPDEEAFARWLDALHERHLADLRFAEVTRALRALSADYVQRRGRVRHSALDGRGKRAAFALFYGPLHFLVLQQVSRALAAHTLRIDHIEDLGCGTGAAGAAVALACSARSITGVDRHPWAVEEAAWTYRHFRISHRTIVGDMKRTLSSRGGAHDGARAHPLRRFVLAAYTVNELTDEERNAVLPLLLDHVKRGSAVLVVEPIARAVTPWWSTWAAAFGAAGGRADEWRFAEVLPERLRALDRAAGLDHREQTARSLWVPLTGS